MPDEKQYGPNAAPGAAPAAPGTPEADPKLDATREAVGDRFNVPGGLEVAESDASKEFLERQRQQTTENVQNVRPDGEPGGGAFQEDSGGFRELLQEANLSGRHLKFCCGGVLGLMVLAGLVYGGWKLVAFMGDRAANRPEKEVVEEVEVPDEVVVVKDEVEEVEEEYDFLDPSVMTGVMIGEDQAEEDAGVEAGEDLGELILTDEALAELIRDFSSLFEAMQVDVNELLDQSQDRQAAFDDYNNELNYLLYLGRQNVAQLEANQERLNAKFSRVEEEKDHWEERFFEELRELDAYASVAALDEFIEQGQTVVDLRAQFLARAKLKEYYELVMASMEVRVTDLKFNEEALVKGVRVVDVEGSDINLIIDESEL